MERKREFRLRALRLVQLGVQQKAIANRLDISEGTMSRWLESGAGPRADHLDLFDKFCADLQAEARMNYDELPKDRLDQIEAEAHASLASRVLRRRSRERARQRKRSRKTS